jgi:hypothetical protein
MIFKYVPPKTKRFLRECWNTQNPLHPSAPAEEMRYCKIYFNIDYAELKSFFTKMPSKENMRKSVAQLLQRFEEQRSIETDQKKKECLRAKRQKLIRVAGRFGLFPSQKERPHTTTTDLL